VQGAATAPEPDRARQRAVVDAFFAAARDGDFEALVAVLDPDVVLRNDSGRPDTSQLVRGAAAVAGNAMLYSSGAPWVRPALVNGVAGVVVAPPGGPVALLAFTVVGDRIVGIDALTDPTRLQQLDLSAVTD
jgi:RNA polymerase sigma-70 factor (ECF subfamily)